MYDRYQEHFQTVVYLVWFVWHNSCNNIFANYINYVIPCVIETERRVFKSITAAIFHVPYFAVFKPIITSVKTWKTVSLLQSLLRIHGCICWKCASYLNTHLSECQKNLLKRILYFSSDCSVTNNCSGDKQVLLLLWSWPKFCLQDEYLNLLLLFYTDFKLVLS